MMGWVRNDVNDSGMRSQIEASIQSTHHPLQRVVGGLTSRLEWEGWLMNDGMVVEWLEWGWNDEYFWWRKFWTPPSLSIPVIYSHFEMTFSSFDGHSDTEWPKNDWNDAGMTIFSSWNDLEWLEWGWNDSNFWSKANALDFFLSHSVLIQSTFHHSEVIPMPLTHSNVIQSFQDHSIVIQSFWCHPITLESFYHQKHLKRGGLALASLRFKKVNPPTTLCRGWRVDWLF